MQRSEAQERVHTVLRAIDQAAREAGRKSDEIRLMAVSKTHPWQQIEVLHQLGITLFGENRVQEAAKKLPAASERAEKRFHLIGHLQSNKARAALSLFDRIDSVDSLRLAERLERLLDRPYPILLELNTTDEENKHGFTSESDLFSAMEVIMGFTHLRVEGLMTLGPLGGDERAVRGAFARLRRAFEGIVERFDPPYLTELSMGMSSDFAWAIGEGSTCVRVGTALFGAREGV